MLHPGMRMSSSLNIPTRRNKVAKSAQHVANTGPTMLGYVVLICCYRLVIASELISTEQFKTSTTARIHWVVTLMLDA